MENEECWVVETSKDGEHWRFFGKAWKKPREPLLLHAVPRFIRFRPIDEEGWGEPLKQDGGHPMTLLKMEEGRREDLWPTDEHVGLPVLLPGGEEGRLLHFEHDEEPDRWIYTLEFRGSQG